MAGDAWEITGLPNMKTMHHHEVTLSKLQQQDKNVRDLVDTITEFTNPFADKSGQLINIVTRAVMPEKVWQDNINWTGKICPVCV